MYLNNCTIIVNYEMKLPSLDHTLEFHSDLRYKALSIWFCVSKPIVGWESKDRLYYNNITLMPQTTCNFGNSISKIPLNLFVITLNAYKVSIVISTLKIKLKLINYYVKCK